MFREMRRKKQALPIEECEAILRCASSGVLALSGDDGYPYAVPLSFVYDGGKLFFHCARAGHKLDAIAGSDKASFCVIDKDELHAKRYTSYFRSVIVFGRMRALKNDGEKRAAFEALAKRYFPEDERGRLEEIARQWDNVVMLELSPEHISGKQASELLPANG